MAIKHQTHRDSTHGGYLHWHTMHLDQQARCLIRLSCCRHCMDSSTSQRLALWSDSCAAPNSFDSVSPRCLTAVALVVAYYCQQVVLPLRSLWCGRLSGCRQWFWQLEVDEKKFVSGIIFFFLVFTGMHKIVLADFENYSHSDK